MKRACGCKKPQAFLFLFSCKNCWQTVFKLPNSLAKKTSTFFAKKSNKRTRLLFG